MKILTVVAGLLWISAGLGFTDKAAAPFAIVELFASEGCSSCPPADELLGQIATDARASGKNIYTLSFEVDYWDYLGWKDPFSSPQFTERQKRYASVLASSRVYTPQMVVNGKDAFVGSDAWKARRAIAKYLNLQPENALRLTVDRSGSDLKVDYASAHADPDAVINFALVERGLVSHVTAGENNGSTLAHDNIVREFKTADLDGQGTVRLTKPPGNDLSRFSIIAYAQSKTDMTVLAATSEDLR